VRFSFFAACSLGLVVFAVAFVSHRIPSHLHLDQPTSNPTPHHTHPKQRRPSRTWTRSRSWPATPCATCRASRASLCRSSASTDTGVSLAHATEVRTHARTHERVCARACPTTTTTTPLVLTKQDSTEVLKRLLMRLLGGESLACSPIINLLTTREHNNKKR
jgi:hypothetical protein